MSTDLCEINSALDTIPHLAALRELVAERDFYLVGGALRDALLGQQICDIDLVSAQDPTDVARQFAERFSGHWFWLDRERLQSRVLIDGESPLTFDFAPLRATDLAADLAARDFTINSLALPLSAPFELHSIIDPLGGMNDLRTSRLRLSGKQAFVADPLRVLKGIRHAVTLGFVLEQETCDAILHHAWRLENVAVERIRQEVWTILAHPAANRGMELLSTTGVGWHFWGEGFDHQLEGIVATLDRCRAVWSVLGERSAGVPAWLSEDVEGGLSREVLLLWSLSLANISQDLPYDCAEQWQFSRRALARIKAVTQRNDEVTAQFAGLASNPRTLSLFAQKYGFDVTDLFLVAAVLSGLSCEELIAALPCIDEARSGRAEDLVSGEWIAKEFNVPAGPEIGEALEMLRDAEISGEFTDVVGAEAFLHKYYQNKD